MAKYSHPDIGKLMTPEATAKIFDRLSGRCVEMLAEDNKRMRVAGNNLAIAAIRVIRDYDGVHRLSLAVAEWNKAIADEGGRSHGEDKP